MNENDLETLQEEMAELQVRVQHLEALIEDSPEIVDEATDLATFVNEFDPDTHVERALVIGYYLDKFGGQQSFTTSDIEDGYQRARIPSPANMSDVLGDCEDRKWMMQAGTQGQAQLRQLTADGLEHVEEVVEDDS